ncbi:hypothetical protein CcaCcLH18_12044 [Colletotrichum camelliae]|nr:hypothetical protein CcaCcLH18_12044 [Colletotrichum camelliae]
MIDFTTYRRMHPDAGPFLMVDDLGPDVMEDENPDLDDGFFLCLPPRIPGFNMQKKEWVNLFVDFIEDVKWNNEAFEHLVIDSETKELVKAVVTTQLRAEENTDLIRGKGNGLFILLHGGPGTGKTLTAESVAEIAEKPLYRVTCGDIGTKADEVEKYLDTVLMLGKTWGCVVLMDEADVFLEERTMRNLERNALVSVFLRVLEYYDGILILTSNRVGTFDESFKSRIQLNLRYKNLNEQQRLLIWTNFINRIEGLDRQRAAAENMFSARNQSQIDIGINVEQIRKHLPDLAKTTLNGREIRNAISTARQLAVYRGQALAYEHISSVIGEANKFDDTSEPRFEKLGKARELRSAPFVNCTISKDLTNFHHGVEVSRGQHRSTLREEDSDSEDEPRRSRKAHGRSTRYTVRDGRAVPVESLSSHYYRDQSPPRSRAYYVERPAMDRGTSGYSGFGDSVKTSNPYNLADVTYSDIPRRARNPHYEYAGYA